MKDKKKLIITIFCILSALLITTGLTMAVFTYTKTGDTENTITTGKLTFLYTENTGTGTGINITDAFPVSDELGKAYSSDDQVFDFKVESEIVGDASIPYEVTVGKTSTSTLGEEYIKLYLTDTTEDDEVELLEPTLYSELPESATEEDEKQIYFDEVEANENYLKKFRLRMWIKEDSNQEDINDKTFTIKVNVYSNEDVVKREASVNLVQAILNNNELITTAPTLTTTSKLANENGLYKSTDTNSGEPTYYFRGVVENNYVSFAGQTWRIVRINEDGTIRLVLQQGFSASTSFATRNETSIDYMYYTNSYIKSDVETWYANNLASYSSKIATGNYFCEEVGPKDTDENGPITAGNATMVVYTDYIPDFKCNTDGNGHGLVNSNIGLLTYDEIAYAGGKYRKANDTYYLKNGQNVWTMSPAGSWFPTNPGNRNFLTIGILNGGGGYIGEVSTNYDDIRPVINLTSDVIVKGIGTITNPYIVQ